MAREKLQNRLESLRVEFDKGQKQMHEIQQRENYLKETLLRIQGAIQVLEELLADEESKSVGLHSIEAGVNAARLA